MNTVASIIAKHSPAKVLAGLDISGQPHRRADRFGQRIEDISVRVPDVNAEVIASVEAALDAAEGGSSMDTTTEGRTYVRLGFLVPNEDIIGQTPEEVHDRLTGFDGKPWLRGNVERFEPARTDGETLMRALRALEYTTRLETLQHIADEFETDMREVGIAPINWDAEKAGEPA